MWPKHMSCGLNIYIILPKHINILYDSNLCMSYDPNCWRYEEYYGDYIDLSSWDDTDYDHVGNIMEFFDVSCHCNHRHHHHHHHHCHHHHHTDYDHILAISWSSLMLVLNLHHCHHIHSLHHKLLSWRLEKHSRFNLLIIFGHAWKKARPSVYKT